MPWSSRLRGFWSPRRSPKVLPVNSMRAQGALRLLWWPIFCADTASPPLASCRRRAPRQMPGASDPPMRFLSDRDLVDLLPPRTLIQVIEQSLRDFADHRVAVPRRQHTHFGDNALLTMPVIGSQAFGAKIVSVVPSN